MATVIRLKRVGAKKAATYRIVVTDSRRGTSGKYIEGLGSYNPRTRPSHVRIDAARTLYWLKEGATPSDTVHNILKQVGVWRQFQAGGVPPESAERFTELGPEPGQRGTSQRPSPTDRTPKSYAEAAAEAAGEDEPAEAAEPSEDSDTEQEE